MTHCVIEFHNKEQSVQRKLLFFKSNLLIDMRNLFKRLKRLKYDENSN